MEKKKTFKTELPYSKQGGLNQQKSKQGVPKLITAEDWRMLPIIFFTAIIILIVRLAPISNPLTEIWWGNKESVLWDFFTYYKMIAIVVISFLALTILLQDYIAKGLKGEYSTLAKPSSEITFVYVPMLIYFICVVLSFGFSEHKEFSVLGLPETFEGTLVLVGYMTMLFYTLHFVKSERNVKWVLYSVLTVCGLLGILGVSQGIGCNFLETAIGKQLILPMQYWDQSSGVNFKFQNNEIYQTLYTVNYVAFYLVLVIPIVTMLFLKKGGHRKEKLLLGGLFALLMYNFTKTSSSGGLLALFITAVIGILIFGKVLLREKKGIGILIVVTLVMSAININTLLPEVSHSVKSALNLNPGIQAHENTRENLLPVTHRPAMEFIETNQNNVRMSLNGVVLTVGISEEGEGVETPAGRIYASTEALDGNDLRVELEPIGLENNPYEYRVKDERFDFCTVSLAAEGQYFYLVLNTPDVAWPFAITEKGILYRLPSGDLLDLKKVESLGFKGREGFGSGRGYIWSRSLPILKETFFLGKGADNFKLYFPQEDFAGKYTGPSFQRNIFIITDKPHSFYLGVAINTGILSLISLMILFGGYLWKSVRIYRKDITHWENTGERKGQEHGNDAADGFLRYAGMGISLGIFGFILAGAFYDSNICTMPIFYGLLGLGIAINRINFASK